MMKQPPLGGCFGCGLANMGLWVTGIFATLTDELSYSIDQGIYAIPF